MTAPRGHTRYGAHDADSTLSDEHYIALGGDTCPECGRTYVVRDVHDTVQDYGGDGRVLIPCSCGECGATWHETYKLEGYYDCQPGHGLGDDSSCDTPNADVG